MRNLLALVGLATVTFVGLGWYLGWYKIQRNSSELQVGINTEKVTHDVRDGVEKVGELINSIGSKDNTHSSWYDPTPAPTQPPVNNLASQHRGWYEPTQVPPATAKPSGWHLINRK